MTTSNIKGAGSVSVGISNGVITVTGTDNNTTYGTGNTTTSGLTKLYTETGTAEDGTMTQKAIDENYVTRVEFGALSGTAGGLDTRVNGLETSVSDLETAVGARVTTEQGSTNANRIMITDASGSITPVAVTTSGTGSLVTGVSVADGELTVTKGSSLPTVNNATLTIKNGATNTDLATFTANSSSAATATIPAATPSVAGLAKIGVIPSGSATSTTYATIWVE